MPATATAHIWPWDRSCAISEPRSSSASTLIVVIKAEQGGADKSESSAPATTLAAATETPAVSDTDEVIQRCRAGDRDAFRALFALHRSEVARLVHRMLGASNDLEDVIQEVFLQVHRSIKDFRGNSRFTTWLYRLTVNVVLMHRRAARSRPALTEPLDTQLARDSGPLPDEQVARLARIRAFYRLLDRLTDKKRVVFVLHELEGMSPADIGKVVGAPVLTVRTRLFYARRELAELLREEPTLAALADLFAAEEPAQAVSEPPLTEPALTEPRKESV
jgi:RNA polymerase sigma-70 factor (ECF subfamily)